MTLLPDTDPILLQKSLPVDPAEIKTKEFQQMLADLYSCMIENKGIGISAVQVGILKRVMFVKNTAMINPTIAQKSHALVDIQEGCLTFPGKQIKVKRPGAVRVKFIDKNSKLKYIQLNGLEARVFLHEYDHLEGILFTKYER